MRSEWPEIPLDELTDGTTITYGVVKPGDECEGGVKFVRGGDVVAGRILTAQLRTITPEVSQQYARTLLRGGELLVSLVGNPGEVALVPVSLKDANIARQVGLVRIDKDKADANYVQYFLRSKVGRDVLLAHSKGSVQQVINLKDLKSVKLPLPPINVQRSVAGFMQALDDCITLLRETNATLEAIAQALFKSWFVDFDPVRAKMEGRAPEGMDEATAALFPDSFEETALGMVPRGWRIGRLDDLLVLQRGFDLPSQERRPGDFPIIAASGSSGTHMKAMVRGPGVVTGRSGVLGKVFLELGDFWPLNTTLWVKTFKAATPCFAYELLRKLDFKSYNAGSAVPTLNRNHIHSLPYVIPDVRCVEHFDKLALPIHLRCSENEKQAQTLATLRDTLLPRLISGQLRLPEASQQMEEALA